MEGYTLEIPGGMSLVRLFSRNLQMLNSVSGMWELKGSSYGQQQLKKWRMLEEGYQNTWKISDKNSEIKKEPILLNFSIF